MTQCNSYLQLNRHAPEPRSPSANPRPRPKDRLVEAYLDYLENERNSSAHTLTAYRRALDGFRDAQPNAPGWTECTTDPFRDYLFDLMKRGQARAYVRLQFAALRSFYKYLCQRQAGWRSIHSRRCTCPRPRKNFPSH